MVLLRKIFSLLLFLFCFLSLQGQQSLQPFERVVLNIQQELNTSESVQTPSFKVSKAPHISFGIKCRPDDFQYLKIFRDETQSWESLKRDEHLSYEKWNFSQLIFLHPGQKMPRLKSVQKVDGPVEVHLFNPGNESSNSSVRAKLRSSDCGCTPPELLEREDWCSECHLDSTPVANQPNFIIVHHSAGTNTSSNWAAVVRSIWDYHVNTRGWDDIGYNYLIDPNGEIYVGRGDEILGAHFCGTNSGTLGICMMGEYIDVLPTQAALTKLKLLASWQSCKYDIAPLEQEYHPSSEENLYHLSGHRDGCNTECPGQMLYDQLPELRQDIQFVMDTCGSDTVIQRPIVLEGELSAPFTATLNWSGIPESAEIVRLEYSNDRDQSLRTIGIQNSGNTTELNLRPQRTYTFQIRAFLPDNSEEVSNEVVLSTSDLSEEQIYTNLFPNPTQYDLNVEISNSFFGGFAVSITAFQGHPVYEQTFVKDAVLFEKEIDLSFLPPGMYLIYVQHKQFNMHSKLIKI